MGKQIYNSLENEHSPISTQTINKDVKLDRYDKFYDVRVRNKKIISYLTTDNFIVAGKISLNYLKKELDKIVNTFYEQSNF